MSDFIRKVNLSHKTSNLVSAYPFETCGISGVEHFFHLA